MGGYIYAVTPDFSSVYTAEKMHAAIRIPKDDKRLFDYDSETNSIIEPDEESSNDQETFIDENLNYDPSFSDISSPISATTNNDPDSKPINTDDVSIFGDIDGESPENIIFDYDEEKSVIEKNYVPSAVVDYFNEAALKTKARNELPDSAFGLPRLRKYPLTDQRHVSQAIRMFGHCKDPEDKKVLAKNIVKRHNELGMHVTVGKNNPLYEYVPEDMQENTLTEAGVLRIEGFKPESKRTKKDVLMDHLKNNSVMYNTLFYNDDFTKIVKSIKEFEFFNYFYPSFKLHSFYTRMKTSIGGIAMNNEACQSLHIDNIMATKVNIDLNGVKNLEYTDGCETIVDVSYDSSANWFKSDVIDHTHILYCLKLYQIVHEMLFNPTFTSDSIPAYCNGILLDWETMVNYHYGLMKDCEEYSNEYFIQCQYLHDLLWDPIDDPKNAGAISGNIISMIRSMKNNIINRINESSGEFVTRDSMSNYLVKELGLDDDIFLLPGSLEYPVIDQDSVRFAMDNIRAISNSDITEYVANLNRKYVELGCTFSISVDHPYAKYASDDIVEHMNRVLCESDVVKDDAPDDDTITDSDPWYKTVHYGFFTNREMGPSNSKETEKTSIERMSGML